MRGEHKLQFYQKRIELLEKEVEELKAENSVLSFKNSCLVADLVEKREQMEAMRSICSKTEQQLADEICHAEETRRGCERVFAELTEIKIDYMHKMDAFLNSMRN